MINVYCCNALYKNKNNNNHTLCSLQQSCCFFPVEFDVFYFVFNWFRLNNLKKKKKKLGTWCFHVNVLLKYAANDDTIGDFVTPEGSRLGNNGFFCSS